MPILSDAVEIDAVDHVNDRWPSLIVLQIIITSTTKRNVRGLEYQLRVLDKLSPGFLPFCRSPVRNIVMVYVSTSLSVCASTRNAYRCLYPMGASAGEKTRTD